MHHKRIFEKFKSFLTFCSTLANFFVRKKLKQTLIKSEHLMLNIWPQFWGFFLPKAELFCFGDFWFGWVCLFGGGYDIFHLFGKRRRIEIFRMKNLQVDVNPCFFFFNLRPSSKLQMLLLYSDHPTTDLLDAAKYLPWLS